MEKVNGSNYEGAVAGLSANLGALEPDHRGFLLLERGIAKLLAGDLHGALEDLITAAEVLGEVESEGPCFMYDHCRNHLGYVKFLLGDLDSAQQDGAIASTHGQCGGYSGLFQCLSEEPVTYMDFRLCVSKQYQDKGMISSHAQVVEMVRASEFTTALVIWDEFDARVFGNRNQRFFLQERGVLKRLAGDWTGSSKDLTKALEISPDNEACLKHRAYVNFPLRNFDEARIDAKISPQALGLCQLPAGKFRRSANRRSKIRR